MENQFKGTPGPWIAKRLVVTTQDEKFEIADTWNQQCDYPSKQEAVANTQLIASAPELLEALTSLNIAIDNLWKQGINNGQAREALCKEQYKADKAINKATNTNQ